MYFTAEAMEGVEGVGDLPSTPAKKHIQPSVRGGERNGEREERGGLEGQYIKKYERYKEIKNCAHKSIYVYIYICLYIYVWVGKRRGRRS